MSKTIRTMLVMGVVAVAAVLGMNGRATAAEGSLTGTVWAAPLTLSDGTQTAAVMGFGTDGKHVSLVIDLATKKVLATLEGSYRVSGDKLFLYDGNNQLLGVHRIVVRSDSTLVIDTDGKFREWMRVRDPQTNKAAY